MGSAQSTCAGSDAHSPPFGWIPQGRDLRDAHEATMSIAETAAIASSDHRTNDVTPRTYQKASSSCVAVIAALHHVLPSDKERCPESLHQYAIGQNIYCNGVSLRDAIKTMVRDGVETRAVDGDSAAEHTNIDDIQYVAIRPNIMYVRKALMRGPVMASLTLFDGFGDAVDNQISRPKDEPEKKPLGGCAVLLVGHLEHKGFIVRGPWGSLTGDHGYLYIKDDQLDQLSQGEFWQLRKMD